MSIMRAMGKFTSFVLVLKIAPFTRPNERSCTFRTFKIKSFLIQSTHINTEPQILCALRTRGIPS